MTCPFPACPTAFSSLSTCEAQGSLDLTLPQEVAGEKWEPHLCQGRGS